MEEDQISFWGHLEELRWAVLRSVMALLVFALLSLLVMPYVFDNYIMAATRPDFFLFKYLCQITKLIPFVPDFCNESFKVNIINVNLTSQFFRHITTSLWMAFMLTFPYLTFEIWKFIKPALYEKEKRNIRWVLLFGSILFFAGCFVGYALIFPITLRFFVQYELSSTIENLFSLDSYMDMFIALMLAMGVMFELPIVCWFLSQMGIINRSFFKLYRRHAIVILAIVSAIITPSGDPITLGFVFIPIYILYELSAIVVKPAPKEVFLQE